MPRLRLRKSGRRARCAIFRANPAIEVNFVDPFVRKGYRFAGAAKIVQRGAAGFEEVIGAFGDYGDLVERMRAVVTIAVAKALPIVSPAYDRGASEAELRRQWTAVPQTSAQ